MRAVDMTKGNIAKQLITFAIPILLTNLLQNLYNAADSLMVGRFCDGNGLAAVGTTEPLCNCLIGLFLGVGAGVSVVVSRAYGAGDVRGVHKAVHNGIALSIVCGIAISVIGLVFAPQMLQLIQVDPEIFEQSLLYLRIYFLGAVFLVIYNIGAGILRAVGDSKNPLIFLCVSAVTNVGLNFLFIAILKLGVAGAAIATSISQLVSACLVIITLARSEGAHKLYLKEIAFERVSLISSLKVGVPTGLQSMVIALSNVIIQAFVNSYGAAATAGSSAATKVDNFILLITQSLSLALMSFVGQNLGAGNLKRAKQGTAVSIFLAVSLMLITGIIATIFRESVVSVFVDKNDPNRDEIIYFGAMKAFFVSAPYFIVGINDNLSSFLRAAGKATVPMITYIMTMCVFRISWIFFFRHWVPFVDTDSLSSVFVVYPISFVLTAITLLTYFFMGTWKKKLDL